MWREVTGKVVFSRRLERAFDCIFGIKNKNQEILAWLIVTLTKRHPRTRPFNYLMLESSTSSELLCSGLDTFSWPYLPLVASVGPEALRVLHEYISGDFSEGVLDNSSGKPR